MNLMELFEEFMGYDPKIIILIISMSFIMFFVGWIKGRKKLDTITKRKIEAGFLAILLLILGICVGYRYKSVIEEYLFGIQEVTETEERVFFSIFYFGTDVIKKDNLIEIRFSDISSLVDELDKIKDEVNKTILLVPDCYGGTISDIVKAVDLIKNIKENNIFVSYIYNALSGGYVISMYSDKIYAHPTAMIGGLGTMFSRVVYNDEEFTIEYVTKSPYKLTNEELTEEQRGMLEQVIESIDNYFCSELIENRNLNSTIVENEIMTGYIWTGLQAKEIGLIDEVKEYIEMKNIEELPK